MKPELNLAARHAWVDPAAARIAAPGRNFWAALFGIVIVACLALALARGQVRPRGFGPYSVSVPRAFRPYDPARWATMHARTDARRVGKACVRPCTSQLSSFY